MEDLDKRLAELGVLDALARLPENVALTMMRPPFFYAFHPQHWSECEKRVTALHTRKLVQRTQKARTKSVIT